MWDQILQFLHSTGAYIDTDKGFVVVVVVVVVKNYRFVQMLNFDLSSSYRLGVHSSVYSIICYIWIASCDLPIAPSHGIPLDFPIM